MNHLNTKIGAKTAKRRSHLPAIDRDTSKRATHLLTFDAHLSARLVSDQRQTPKFKDGHAALRELCLVTLARSSFPEDGRSTVLCLMSLLDSTTRLTHDYRSDVGEALNFLMPLIGELSCHQVFKVLDNLYQATYGYFRASGCMEDYQIEGSGIVSTLMDLKHENRIFHQMAATIESFAKAQAGNHDDKVREASLNFAFVGQALRAMTPARLILPVNACVLCHRHEVDRLICLHHVEDNRYTASLKQRKLFDESLALGKSRILQAAQLNEAILREILGREANGELEEKDAQSAYDVLMAEPVSEKKAQLGSMWSMAMKNAPSNSFDIGAVASAWYALPNVNDSQGSKRLKQPMSSVLLKLINDISRFDCFVAIGGEIPRQRRKYITDKNDIEKIMRLRQEGSTLAEISSELKVSATQVRRILDEP